jgi:hypothetical protein
VEVLEPRRLFAGEPWSQHGILIGQDEAAADHASMTGAGQTIAIIDTGIDYTHPLLGGGIGAGQKVIDGYDFVDGDSDPLDTFGHGTQVAGMLASDEFLTGGRRHRGVAPDAKLVALRVGESDEPVPDERIEAALRWVIDNRTAHHITIVNISFGYGSHADAYVSPIFGDELKALDGAGVLVIASSGNNGVSAPARIQYPAADPSVFAVGSTDRYGVISEFTERSALLDMVAPGDGVMTTTIGGQLAGVSGTSFAAPLVAGTAALMRQADPALRPADIRSILRASATDNVDGDDEFGATTALTYPRLDVDDALALTLLRKPSPLGARSAIGDGGNGNALTYDAEGVLHFTFFDVKARTLKYATRSTLGAWSPVRTIDTSGPEMGHYSSLALDQFGRPSIAYFDGIEGDLEYARFDGSSWALETVDWKHSVGLYPSMRFDRDNRPVISYYHKGEGDLRIARRESDNTGWDIEIVDAESNVGRANSMAVDAAGNVAVAYADSWTGELKFVRQAGDTWGKMVVDGTIPAAGWMSLAFDAADRPAIAYYDADPANLKFAAQAPKGWWGIETLTSKGAVGLYPELAFDEAGAANIIYYNRSANLTMLASGGIGAWNFNVLQEGGGRYISLVKRPTGGITYSWFNTDEYTLHVNDV